MNIRLLLQSRWIRSNSLRIIQNTRKGVHSGPPVLALKTVRSEEKSRWKLGRMKYDFYFSLVGYVAIAYVSYRALKKVYRVVYPYVLSRPLDLKKKAGGNWAVITGATDGIGKAYAFELAKRGFNILLISRTQGKLDATKNEILEVHNKINVETYAYDFTNADVRGYEKMLEEINNHEVGILVNNVGMFHDYPEVLHKTDGGIKKLADISVVNTLPPLLLSAGVLDQMARRHSGIIINISSSSGEWATPMWAIYSSSKKFVTWFSEIVRREYDTEGVIIQTLNPFMVSTKMSKESPSLFVPTPEKYVNSALSIVGRASDTTGYIYHQIQLELIRLMPSFLLDSGMLKFSKSLRDKALEERKTRL